MGGRAVGICGVQVQHQAVPFSWAKAIMAATVSR